MGVSVVIPNTSIIVSNASFIQLAVKAYVNVPMFKDNPAQIIQFLFIIMNDYTKIHESNTIPLIQFSKVVKRISEMQYDPF